MNSRGWSLDEVNAMDCAEFEMMRVFYTLEPPVEEVLQIYLSEIINLLSSVYFDGVDPKFPVFDFSRRLWSDRELDSEHQLDIENKMMEWLVKKGQG